MMERTDLETDGGLVMEPLQIVVADDHPVYRDGVTLLFDSEPDLSVVGQAATGEEAVLTAAATQPDVVVMDLNMPVMGGVEATRRIVTTSPHIAVLVLTMMEDNDSLFAAMRAGATGYLLKDAAKDEILRAVRSVAAGTAVFGPAIAHRVIDYFSGQPASATLPFPELTEREREVLTLIGRGENNARIARALFISPKTARNHVSNILAKLQVADRAQAIIRAREAGLS
jgi:DNA-binding NarL/FixJ family response regulator